MQSLTDKVLEGRKKETAFCLLKEKIKSNRPFTFELARSYSMFPLLVAGDIVTVKNVMPQQLLKGELVVFRVNNNLCVHRYISKVQKEDNSLGFVTKGDNSPNFDPWLISSRDLFGKVISIKKKHGEINLENIFWRINNYLLVLFSSFQAYIFKFSQRIKRALWKDKRIPSVSSLKRFLFFPLRFLLKFILFIETLKDFSRLAIPFIKK